MTTSRAMTTSELRAELSLRGVDLWVAGDRLRYRARKGALTSDLLEELSRNKSELMALLRDGNERVPAFYPLSYGQRALWFVHKLAPGSAAYNAIFAARIRAEVDPAALKRAFKSLVERHAILRTTYIESAGDSAVQQVHQSIDFEIPISDASGWSEAELNKRMIEAAHQPFNLEQGPVWRGVLFAVSPQESIFLLAVHHIAIDVLSYAVLISELCLLYSAEKAGVKAALPPPRAVYSDYVRWQAEMLSSAEGERLWTYWQQQLAGELPELNLPTDHIRTPVQTYQGSSHTFVINKQLTQAIRALAEKEGVTLYTTLLAAFQTLLYRYTGQEDILIGCPTGGRSRADFESVVGYFVNPLVLRGDLSGEPLFSEYLARTYRVVRDALAHQDFPFPLLVERLRPVRDPSRSPLFQVTFTLDKLHQLENLSEFVLGLKGTSVEIGGLELETVAVPEQEGQFDLDLLIVDTGNQLSASLKYNTELFEEATVKRMGSQLLTLLEAVVAEPGRRLSELPLLSAEEQQLLREWNDTVTEFSGPPTVDGLIAAQAERTPTSTAVECQGEKLSYAELNRRANQLARYLRRQGVGSGMLVGILLERSVEVVVALLGVLKAGAAYVPLEVSHPTERIELMMKDAGVAVVLTQERVAGVLSTAVQNGSGVRVINLDEEREAIGSESEVKIEEREEAAGAELAYVIYTSGSTGRPKGVMVSHSAVINLLNSMRQHVSISEKDVLLAVTTMSFDIAGLEMFLPLTVGARLVIYAEPVFDGLKLSQALTNSAATIMQAVPVTWQLLLRSGWPGNPHLKALCGGDSLSQDLANMLREKCGTVWNVYGPTETTIWSTIYRVEGPQKTVSIGRPLANTQLHLLDSHLRPVPVGVAGELYIGGYGLARGYMNRPELTADRFIPNALDGELGGRLYRTGDLARYRTDGNIEFLGRMDHQVKLHGFRIELGEIEAVLRQHPKVRETVVVPRNGPLGERQLVAYLVADGEPATVFELRHFLAQKLPAYMVPSAFVHLEAWPLTPNGKIDRKALPAPDFTRSDGKESYVAPRNTMEEILAQTCAQVLNLERVGVHDNFFELGGASLASVEITAVLNHAGIPLSPEMLFEYQTIAQLAEALTKRL